MVNRGYVAIAVLLLTGWAVAMVAGHHPWDGPELFRITHTHGVNLGDVPVLAAWGGGIAYCTRLWRRR